jgi:hypothetical protein
MRDRLMTRLDLSLSLARKRVKGVGLFVGNGSCKGHSAPPGLTRDALLQEAFLVTEI